MKLVVAGSAALDTIITPSAEKKDLLGGSSLYAAIGASFFSPVGVISAVGKDFPSKYLKTLERRNIDITGLEIKNGKSFRWKAAYPSDYSHAHTISTELNVFSGYKPVIPEMFVGAENLLLANMDPDFQNYVLTRIRPRGIVVCDTMNLWIENCRNSLRKLIKKTHIFVLNDAEARQMSGEKDLLKAAKFIYSMGAGAVVIKKGENGAFLFSGGLDFIMPAYLTSKVKDPTGAGDTFAGGMMGYISSRKKVNDKVLRTALVHGSIMASFAVERFSAASLALVSQADLDARFQLFNRLTRI